MAHNPKGACAACEGANMYEHIIMYYLMLEDFALIRGDFVEFDDLEAIALAYCVLQDIVA
jgi:hypothetical protein